MTKAATHRHRRFIFLSLSAGMNIQAKNGNRETLKETGAARPLDTE